MSATMMKSSVLVLTSDPEQIIRLQRKLAEYERRYAFTAPEVDPPGIYRYRLLSRLLAEKVLDIDQIELEFLKQSWYQNGAFREAVAIISAYNSGDLTLIRGGSGLK